MKLFFLGLSFLFSIISSSQAPKILYVNSTATGSNDGSSWNNAFKNLSAAITASVKKDTIKVAKGVYTPGNLSTNAFILKDSVVMLGGYPNSGSPSDSQRNWAVNPTILSGEIGSPDITWDNTKTIIGASGLHKESILDGFIIEGGYNNSQAGNPAALGMTNSSLTVLNCLFRKNTSDQAGIVFSQNGSPSFINCIFVSNIVYHTSLLTLYNSNVAVVNCIFSDNEALNLIKANQGTTRIINSTFFRNYAWSHPSSSQSSIVGESSATLSIVNSIFFRNMNSHSVDSSDIGLNSSTATVSHCITQVYKAGTAVYAGVNPKFRDTANIAGPDNIFFTADDGLQLTNPCSIGMNMGLNSAVLAATDILGNTRVKSMNVDLGPYEMQSDPLTSTSVLYVNKSATGANNGTSWADAYTDLQMALQSCSDTIKVAAGTYFPSDVNSETSFWLENNRILLGGYSPIGNPSDAQRDAGVYSTVLSGNLGNGIKSNNVVQGKYLDSTAVLDGFIVREAGHNPTDIEYLTFYGSVFLRNESKPIFRNCVFKDNTGVYTAIVLRSGSAPLFYNCVFDSNYTNRGLSGGAVTNFQSNPVFIKCIFKNNKCNEDIPYGGGQSYFGGAILNFNSNPVFDSCYFIKNVAKNYGGAIANKDNSNPIIKNSIFLGNKATTGASDILNDNSSPRVYNSVFSDSTMAEDGGSMMNLNRSKPYFERCEFANSRALYRGSAVFNDNSDPTFKHCVFHNTQGTMIYSKNYSKPVIHNSAAGAFTGIFMYNEKSFAEVINTTVISTTSTKFHNRDSSRLVLRNSILWGARSSGSTTSSDIINDPPIFGIAASSAIITNSFTEVYGNHGVNGNSVGINPRLFEYNDPDGLDNKFFTADDGLRLTPCSPAVNSGNNSYLTGINDLLDNSRVIGSSVDCGPYELQLPAGNVPRTYYVNASATGNNDGTSWANAYNNLWSAINNICADTIKVAAGTYKPAVFARDSSFTMLHGKVYMGGYPGTGNPQDSDRDPDLFPAILSGNIGGPDSSDNTLHVVHMKRVDGKLVFDGFEVSDGYSNISNGEVSSASGAGILIHTSDIWINKTSFKRNYAISGGGGLYTVGTKFLLTRSIFSNNKTNSRGGAIYLNGSNGIIESCVLDSNYSNFIGGGGFLSNSNVKINNTIFYANTSAGHGGGLYIQTPNNIYITNSNFVNNNCGALSRGAGIYNYQNPYSNFPVIKNSIFKGNRFDEGDYLGGSDIFDSDCLSYDCDRTNVVYNRIQSYDGGSNNIILEPQFANISDPDGPDNIWMTADDGLRLLPCSGLINKGTNIADTAIPKDIIQNARILYGIVDLGAYEYDGSANSPLAATGANQVVVANKEITDASGWTHYFNDCSYLLSVKKAGQNIGTIGDGNFEVKIVTKPGYGSGQASNLTTASYNTSGYNWYSMNRYWNIKSTNPVADSILVRFPYTNADYNDLKGSNPAITSHQQIEFFKVSGTNDPLDLTVPVSSFSKYINALQPSLNNWTYNQVDSIHLCDYYVRSFSGGSGGYLNNGEFADLLVNALSVPATVSNNSNLSVSFKITNQGNVASGTNKLKVFISSDNQLTPNSNGDILIDQRTVSFLNTNTHSGPINMDLFIPCTVIAGNYYLFFIADADNQIPETNETNNSSSVAVNITTGQGQPVIPVIVVSPSSSGCYPTNFTLTANSEGCSDCSYTWSNGATGPVISGVLATGGYTVTATNACGSSIATQHITQNPLPSISISTSAQRCGGQLISLTATGATTYTWTGPGLASATGPTVNAVLPPAGTATYSVTGTTDGCSKQESITITIDPPPVINILQSDTTICTGESLQLIAQSFGATTTTWSPATSLNTTSGLSVIATPVVPTMYYLTATSESGCLSKDSVFLNLLNNTIPSVEIQYTGCPGNTLTFQATGSNTGNNPIYQWFVNNILSGTGNPFVLNGASNNTQVYAKLTSNAVCASPQIVNSNSVNINCIVTSLADLDGVEKFVISPNPTNGVFNVLIKLNRPHKIKLEVLSPIGKLMYSFDAGSTQLDFTGNIDLSMQPAGTYFVKVSIGNKTHVEKLLLIK